MQKYIPYCYLIGWSSIDKWYYGCQYSVRGVANPDNLFNLSSRYCYKTSSKYVKETIDLYGLPDVIKIRKTFSSEKECRAWETKVLRRLDVIHDNRFLNKTHNQGIPSRLGIPLAEKHLENIRIAAKNRDYTGTNNPNYGNPNGRSGTPSFFKNKKHREESKLKISEASKGSNNPMYGVHRYGESAPNWGKKHSQETKSKMSKPRKSTDKMKNKFYITNGLINKKLDIGSEIPEGFWKGRNY